MTKARQAVIEVLASSAEPLSAAAVFQYLGSCCDQATVYRTLHYLEEHGFADSFILHCEEHGTERYYTALAGGDGKPAPHRHWFHCERCHRFIDLGGCKIDRLVSEYETEYGIQVKSHTLYFTGLCGGCGGAAGR